ncbi:copper resistance protein NlpE [Salinivibrio sp. ES.052]|uniref:copper resistance protein NlpE n=1 Tax=Salinivibrio sp. ES.052 TaxID=1882823 RepID=UPI00092A002C|nr:copper resistance protein NlpE [Salinivibrio sp. ES.052]SIO37622.1 Uncharacterized lipoprotein NlpE involved in copper resistance [Salinivibrio sp. ES.052]
MKKTYLLAPLALVAVLVGCEQQANEQATTDTQVESTLENAQETAKEGAEQAMDSAESAIDSAENTVSEMVDHHNAKLSLDWNGTYQGVVPCADCEGIDTTLTLNQDKTYSLTKAYLGKEGEALKEEGTFTWDETGSVVILEGLTDSPNHFFVAENQVIMQDMNGETIEGDLAEMYHLKKQ